MQTTGSTFSSEFETALLNLDRLKADQIFNNQLIDNSILNVIEAVVTPALIRIGDAWSRGDLALSQNYMAGRIAEDVVTRYLPASNDQRYQRPRIGITTLGDYHLLGKKIVTSILRSSGYNVIDYNTDMKLEDLVSRLIEDGVDIFLTSTLMLNNALMVGELKKELDSRGLNIKLVVGGAPFLFDDRLLSEVGADAMGSTASDVLRLIREYALNIDFGTNNVNINGNKEGDLA